MTYQRQDVKYVYQFCPNGHWNYVTKEVHDTLVAAGYLLTGQVRQVVA